MIAHAMAGGVQHCHIPGPYGPWGWPGPDAELERLRRLKEAALREEEKQRLRDWLRQHGVQPDPAPWPGLPLPCPIARPCPPLSLKDVLRRLG